MRRRKKKTCTALPKTEQTNEREKKAGKSEKKVKRKKTMYWLMELPVHVHAVRSFVHAVQSFVRSVVQSVGVLYIDVACMRNQITLYIFFFISSLFLCCIHFIESFLVSLLQHCVYNFSLRLNQLANHYNAIANCVF